MRCAPSPRLRGEGWGEEESPQNRTRRVPPTRSLRGRSLPASAFAKTSADKSWERSEPPPVALAASTAQGRQFANECCFQVIYFDCNFSFASPQQRHRRRPVATIR